MSDSRKAEKVTYLGRYKSEQCEVAVQESKPHLSSDQAIIIHFFTSPVITNIKAILKSGAMQKWTQRSGHGTGPIMQLQLA